MTEPSAADLQAEIDEALMIGEGYSSLKDLVAGHLDLMHRHAQCAASPPPPEGLREEVARIIEPLKWAILDDVMQPDYDRYGLHGESAAFKFAFVDEPDKALTSSLAKADAILSKLGSAKP